MPRQTSRGRCFFCGGTFASSGMTRHLMSCKGRPSDVATPTRRRSSQRVFHLVVSGRYAPMYWLHLEASSTASLEAVDELLRDTWLECCGHLSAFRLGDRRFSTPSPFGDWSEDESSSIALGKLLAVGQTLEYEYDFGSTTELTIRVVGERPGRPPEALKIVARNDPPEIACTGCAEGVATMLCSECNMEGEGWLCDACAAAHKRGETELTPIPNSPRAGVCGYTGFELS